MSGRITRSQAASVAEPARDLGEDVQMEEVPELTEISDTGASSGNLQPFHLLPFGIKAS